MYPKYCIVLLQKKINKLQKKKLKLILQLVILSTHGLISNGVRKSPPFSSSVTYKKTDILKHEGVSAVFLVHAHFQELTLSNTRVTRSLLLLPFGKSRCFYGSNKTLPPVMKFVRFLDLSQ